MEKRKFFTVSEFQREILERQVSLPHLYALIRRGETMTLDTTYSHLLPDIQDVAVKALEGIFVSGRKKPPYKRRIFSGQGLKKLNY